MHPLRDAHFHRLHDSYVREIDGELVDVLDAQLLVDWLVKYKNSPVLLDAIHDIPANVGIAVNLPALRGGKTAISDLLIDNREPAGGPIIFPLETVAHILTIHEKTKAFEKRDILIEFLRAHGLEPNMIRIRAEMCPTCGK